MSHRIPLLLLLAILSGCGGLPKPGAAPALYDFGIATTSQQPVPVKLGHVEAAPGLDGYEMRYRLAYQNPAQVFSYTESRWATLPADLVAQRLQNQWVSAADAGCTLHLTLDVFDQVFDSAAASHGVVQLHATLVNGGARGTIRTTTVIKAEKTSASADAKGGVAALTTATDEAITKLKMWVSEQQCAAPSGEK